MFGSAAILAGGASSRFGSPKQLYELNGRPMVTVVAERLRGLFGGVFAAGWPHGLPAPDGLPCFEDIHVGKGALGGIHTAITNAGGDWVFCCGCDMPLIQATVIGRIIESIGDEDILLPVINGTRQPLHAVYKRRILPMVERLCTADSEFLPDLLARVEVRYLEEAWFADLPDYALSFVSMNDRLQLEKYRAELALL
ncbi:MAG: molybdenum cofactor guanylyltransferase [Candidatus Zixiibacteriota bacterium]